ncbi:MAG: hypothetical protein AAGJ87_07940, partial [Pseudomonadota bacterium]
YFLYAYSLHLYTQKAPHENTEKNALEQAANSGDPAPSIRVEFDKIKQAGRKVATDFWAEVSDFYWRKWLVHKTDFDDRYSDARRHLKKRSEETVKQWRVFRSIFVAGCACILFAVFAFRISDQANQRYKEIRNISLERNVEKPIKRTIAAVHLTNKNTMDWLMPILGLSQTQIYYSLTRRAPIAIPSNQIAAVSLHRVIFMCSDRVENEDEIKNDSPGSAGLHTSDKSRSRSVPRDDHEGVPNQTTGRPLKSTQSLLTNINDCSLKDPSPGADAGWTSVAKSGIDKDLASQSASSALARQETE